MGLAWCADHAGPLLAPGYRNLAVIRLVGLRAAPADMTRAYRPGRGWRECMHGDMVALVPMGHGPAAGNYNVFIQ